MAILYYIVIYSCSTSHQVSYRNIVRGSWKSRGNQYIRLVKVLYCKLSINVKPITSFQLEDLPGLELQSKRCEASVLPLHEHGHPYYYY